MTSKSITVILSYTVSKFMRFWDTVYSGLLLSSCNHIQLYISILQSVCYHICGVLSCCRVFWKVLLERIFHVAVLDTMWDVVHDVTAIFNRFDTNTLITCFSADIKCINYVVSQSEHLQRVFCYERIYNCTFSWTSCMFRTTTTCEACEYTLGQRRKPAALLCSLTAARRE